MKATCLKENLHRSMNITGGAIAAKGPMPILQNVLIQAHEGKLTFSGTNLETTITTSAEAQVEEPGAAAVPARLFSEFIGTLPDGPVELAIAEGAGMLRVTAGKTNTNINAANPQDFPPIPTAGDEAQTASVQAQALRDGIKQLVFAAADSEVRPVLTGVDLKLQGDSIVMAAADGFRLAVYRNTLENQVEEGMQAIIPAKTLALVERLIRNQEEPVGISIGAQRAGGQGSHQQAVFHVPEIEIVSRLLQGAFPDYERLIPADSTTSVTLDVKELQRAARSTAAFARDDAGITRMELTPEGEGKGTLAISAKAQDTGENRVTMEVEITRGGGEGQRIAFNSRYLRDFLSAVSAETLSLSTSSQSSPGVFRSGNEGEYTHIIMPMEVRDWA